MGYFWSVLYTPECARPFLHRRHLGLIGRWCLKATNLIFFSLCFWMISTKNLCNLPSPSQRYDHSGMASTDLSGGGFRQNIHLAVSLDCVVRFRWDLDWCVELGSPDSKIIFSCYHNCKSGVLANWRNTISWVYLIPTHQKQLTPCWCRWKRKGDGTLNFWKGVGL
jgi:hypothetical protein